MTPTDPHALAQRTLADYRPQHDEDCAVYMCVECGAHRHDTFAHGYNKKCDDFTAFSCSCGLDALLKAGAQALRSHEDKDHSAGLIGQAIPESAETKPSPHDLQIAAGAPYFCSKNHPLDNVAWEGMYRRGTCECGRVLAWSGKGRP